MNIDETYRFVNFIANKKQYGQIKPNDFNLLAPQAQMQAIMNAFGNPRTYQNGRPIPIIGHTMTTKTQDNLKSLLVRDDNEGSGFSTTDNELAYPPDYLHIDVLEKMNGKPIDHLLTSEIGKRRKSLIKGPDETYPISAMYSDKIRIYPDLTDDIVIVYVKIPATPKWAYIPEGTNPVYDSENSVNFDLPIDMHNEIAMNILQFIGINLGREELTQYAQSQELKGI